MKERGRSLVSKANAQNTQAPFRRRTTVRSPRIQTGYRTKRKHLDFCAKNTALIEEEFHDDNFGKASVLFFNRSVGWHSNAPSPQSVLVLDGARAHSETGNTEPSGIGAASVASKATTFGGPFVRFPLFALSSSPSSMRPSTRGGHRGGPRC